jgi:hypothetical protein
MGNSPSTKLMYKRREQEITRAEMPDPEYYKLVDDKGGGTLVLLAKNAIKSGNTDLLDRAIKENIPDYLYNNGKGEHVIIFFSSFLLFYFNLNLIC